jgi:predicted nucleotide-binding protein (sugar kinase/HSP70/actin superfamily)
MSEKLFNENDTPWDVCKKTITSIIFDGFESTHRKIMDEIKDAYNNPLKIDAKKMMEGVIDEINERGKKEIHGEGHEYIFHGNLNNGVQEWIDVTGMNLQYIDKETIQKLRDKIKQNTP